MKRQIIRSVGALSAIVLLSLDVAASGCSRPTSGSNPGRGLDAGPPAQARDSATSPSPDQSIDDSLNRLGAPDPWMRASAAAALGKSKNPRAIAPLLALLGEKVPKKEKRIRSWLVLEDDRVALNDDESHAVPYPGATAGIALANLVPASTATLIEAAQSPDLTRRRNAIFGLGQREPLPDAFGVLRSASVDEDMWIRLFAVTGLSKLAKGGSTDAATQLKVVATKDKLRQVRDAAKTALGESGHQ